MDDWVVNTRATAKRQWEGEDDEREVLESWDAEEEESESVSVSNEEGSRSSGVSLVTEKIHQRRLQEADSLRLACDIFGVSTSEEFERFAKDITSRINDATKNTHFFRFAEDIVTAICSHMNSSEIKRVQTLVTNFMIEKNRVEKGDKSKKSKSKLKAKLRIDDEKAHFYDIPYEDTDYI